MAASGDRAAAGCVGMIRAAVPIDMIKVEPAIAQVAHRAFCSRPAEVGEVDVGHGQRFDILGGLRCDAVPGKG